MNQSANHENFSEGMLILQNKASLKIDENDVEFSILIKRNLLGKHKDNFNQEFQFFYIKTRQFTIIF